MSIVRSEGLSEEAQQVQESAIALVRTDLENLIAEYRRRYGIHVGTDLARELFPDYSACIENKLKYATAVQRSAASVADAVFERILSESIGGPALFTAGGTGAGKTTSITRNAATRQALREAVVIYDSNFNSEKSAKQKIDMALAARCKVVVIFVHRHPFEAYIQGVLPRAVEQGRTVPIESHMRMHRDSRKTFLKMRKLFISNKNVSFLVLSNTGHEAESFTADIDYLEAVRYDNEAVIVAIREGLTCALTKEKITQALYEASCGSARTV